MFEIKEKIKTFYSIFLISLSIFSCNSYEKIDETFTSKDDYVEFNLLNSKVRFVNKKRAQYLLNKEDSFTENLSENEVSCRLNNENLKTSREYREFASDNSEEWTEEDLEYYATTIKEFEKKLKEYNFKFPLPIVVEVMKSNLSEEAGPYTRSNYIVFGSKNEPLNLFAHEFWHVYSRFNYNDIDRFYKIIGFNRSPNEILFPEDLKSLKMTNPDAPFMNHYINLSNEKLGNFYAVPIIFGDKFDNRKGGLISYLLPNLNNLLVLENKDGQMVAKKDLNNNSIIIPYKDTNIYSKIGKNTAYQIHPEEITAEHFSFIFQDSGNSNLPYPDYHLIEKLKEELKK